jgi:LysR family transcriptional regulator, salicylic acid-responsive activator of bsdBCD
MDLRQLKYFLAVAEEGLIVKAAERLHITQPPLSQQLMLLEKELGTRLFIRSKKHIQLTASGCILQRRAGQVLELMKATVNEIQEATDGISGRLSIGVITSFGGALLPKHIAAFHQQYPGVTFDLHQGDTQKITELLKIGIIEIGFVRFPFDMEICESVILPKEAMLLAANMDILRSEADTVPFFRLKGLPLLLHKRHVAMVTQQCHAYGFEPYILCTSDDIFPLLHWARAGLGIAVVPESARSFSSGRSLRFYHTEPSALTTTSALIYARNQPLSAAAMHFMTLFKTDRKKENNA